LAAIQWAAVEPTKPAPTMVIFGRIRASSKTTIRNHANQTMLLYRSSYIQRRLV
jgi:hypothetical protein